MNSTTHITTPIYYASGHPHLGHAYTSVISDCLKRYFVLTGQETRLCTGTDEHGNKIEEKAKLAGEAPLAFVDRMSGEFRAMSNTLLISYDDFIRTTEERHKKVTCDVWSKLDKNGDIYLDHYEGLYCVDCEQYFSESELDEEGRCPTHLTLPKKLQEESFFFRLSKYQTALIEKIDSDEIRIVPAERKNEVLSFLKLEPLRDLSVSRKNLKWGIPVPGHPTHAMYVWIDALVNYLSTLGGLDGDLMQKFWDNTIHVIGKDILRFHAIYWPCMLMSLGIALPKVLVVHGWWTIKNKKISKSDPATKIDPNRLVDDLGADPVRFYLLKSLTLGRDGNLDYSDMISVLNTSLANNIGNLVNRFLSMSFSYFDGTIHLGPTLSNHELDTEIRDHSQKMIEGFQTEMSCFSPSFAIDHILNFSSDLNTFLEKTSPWALMKDEANRERVQEIFAVIGEALRFIGNCLYPFAPTMAGEIKRAIHDSPEFYIPGEFNIRSLSLTKIDPLFIRINPDREADLVSQWG